MIWSGSAADSGISAGYKAVIEENLSENSLHWPPRSVTAVVQYGSDSSGGGSQAAAGDVEKNTAGNAGVNAAADGANLVAAATDGR